ncbi:Protein FMP42 [Exophiala dermatitidis]|uniref:MFS transporter, LAT3 family, solute carrier family 43, member 3 n=1 Tax=Exophiala dermatitidis (strain ATCC 34100 / CBS 525.76 / NIH/UT8656) TaxID=858893 RepID=H6C0K8_EXODN|nr:MFS transporter, LAT3 family, solute carrier family 43, member 3 [Exophiala dermatitidis NIH/UT8656]EHY57248.1 MFS transporter, LAT3 family, solute carrier family 43, member 3 [Exophiala dermatitidis NIH/UT8656]
MSLTRVASVEGFDRERRGSNSSHHRMTFNPVSEWAPPNDRKPSLVHAALEFEEVSKQKRIVQVVIAIIYCLFAAGVVFGYAAIKPVLIDEGVFINLCTPEEVEKHVSPCFQQEIRLNFMFTVAAVSTNVAALPIGTILDRYGPRVCGIIGSIFLALGAFLFSFAPRIRADLFTPGYFFLALGGPFIFISSFQLSNTFPKHSGLILALLTGAFDSSSALFLVFRLIYESTNKRLNTHRLFLIYLVVPLFIFLAQVFLMPKESYKSVSEVVKDAEEEINAPTPPDLSEEELLAYRQRRESTISDVNLLLDKTTNTKRAKREETKNSKSGVWGAMHGHTAWEQIKSPWFVLITLFTVVQMTRINYFVATIRPQERYLLGSEHKAKMVNDFFDVALPLGGVLSIPFIGTLLDHTSTPFALGFLVVVATLIGILGCLPYVWAAIANICLFVVYRPFYYTTVSDYAAKVFGFQTFGKVYGLIICLAGLFNFLQSPLDAATLVLFKGNPIPVNLILMGVAVLVGAVLVVFTYVKSRSMKREQLEAEAEGASEALMPNANGSSYGTTEIR